MRARVRQTKLILDERNCILKRCIDCGEWLPAFPHVFPVVDNQLEPTCWSCEERKLRATERLSRHHDAQLITVL